MVFFNLCIGILFAVFVSSKIYPEPDPLYATDPPNYNPKVTNKTTTVSVAQNCDAGAFLIVHSGVIQWMNATEIPITDLFLILNKTDIVIRPNDCKKNNNTDFVDPGDGPETTTTSSPPEFPPPFSSTTLIPGIYPTPSSSTTEDTINFNKTSIPPEFTPPTFTPGNYTTASPSTTEDNLNTTSSPVTRTTPNTEIDISTLGEPDVQICIYIYRNPGDLPGKKGKKDKNDTNIPVFEDGHTTSSPVTVAPVPENSTTTEATNFRTTPNPTDGFCGTKNKTNPTDDGDGFCGTTNKTNPLDPVDLDPHIRISRRVIIVILKPKGLFGAKPLPRNCEEAVSAQPIPKSGVYVIHLRETHLKPFHVYCQLDPNGGPAWTIFQRRVSDSVEFDRSFQTYRNGFGAPNQNFFMGLERLHVLTTWGQPQELWVELVDPGNTRAYATYSEFAIGDEGTRYTMTVLSGYNGTAGDSLRRHLGQKFTAFDSEQNGCAKTHLSGWWWFNYCYDSNLNGMYGNEHKRGINWKDFRGYEISLPYVHMAIRPSQNVHRWI